MFRNVCIILFIGLGLPPLVLADDPCILTAKAVHASMFKNGYGLITAEVELPNADGNFRVRPLPNSAMGTFWLQWPEEIALTDIRATEAETGEAVPASSIPELLEANIGKTAMIYLDERWHKGDIIDIPFAHDEPLIQPKREASIPHPEPKRRGDLLLWKEAGDVQAIPIRRVEMVRFEEGQLDYKLERPMRENCIEFTSKAKGSFDKPVVTITYLANGIAWSPSYVYEIEGEDSGTISAKAVIVNDLVPLEDALTELIAGYPHIQFTGQTSAFSLTPLQQVIEQLGRGMQRVDSPFMVLNQAADSRAFRRAGVAAVPTEGIAGEQTEDLYFYQVDGVTLKKGERGYFPMFAAKAEFQHTYTWDIPDFIDRNNNYRQDLAEQTSDIWHTLKITNSTPHPWTTAPAMVMKDGRIMGQDTLRYTAPGVETDLKVTKVVSIKTEQNEYETKRDRGAVRYTNQVYDQVTVKGELALTSYKEEPMTVEVTKEVSGEILNATLNPEIVKLAAGLSSVNPKSQLTWEIEVKPGEDNAVKMEYTYTVLLRN